jgi:hypothetical protein
MRVAQVAATVLVLGVALGQAVAGSTPTHVTVCINSHHRVVSASGAHCAAGSHAVSLPTAAGARGKPGARGVPGPRGVAGPFPAVVPSGKTLTGVWTLYAASLSTGGVMQSAVSFDFPFAAGLPIGVVAFGNNSDPTDCTGTPMAPTAAKGHLCLYLFQASNFGSLSGFSPATETAGITSAFGFAVSGSAVATGASSASGSWAATAA